MSTSEQLSEGVVDRAGRLVGWATWGAEGGRRMMQLHGSPGSRLSPTSDLGAYGRLGAHVLSFDRPGYGRSTPDPEQTMLSVADDALAVADHLGWDRFSVLGVSGGGPYALAIGVRAPHRVSRIGLAVGVAPPELTDPSQLNAINRELHRLAAAEDRASLDAFLRGPAAQMAADPIAGIEAAMADAPPVDRTMLEHGYVRDWLAATVREGLSSGPDGFCANSWALASPWGFDLDQVTVPVHMWYGDLDSNVPIAAARAMAARLRVASFEITAGAGHLGWLADEETMLRSLLDAAETGDQERGGA